MRTLVNLVCELLARAPRSLDLPSQVHVSMRGERTTVAIDHRIPTAGSATKGWRITTKKAFLPSAQFAKSVRETVNSASLERGRRLYCIDLERGEVIAALSYHIDSRRRLPVMLTALGLRIDADAMGDLYDCSRGAALLLKQYVHEIASQIGRGGHVDIDADSLDAIRDLTDLGFGRAPQVRGLRVSGTHLRQTPLA